METLLALTLVLLTLALAAQALAYLDTRLLARDAVADAAHTAAQEGVAAGISRAHAILAAAAGLSSHLQVGGTLEGSNDVTIMISGNAPTFGLLGPLVPRITEQASLPLERYSTAEIKR